MELTNKNDLVKATSASYCNILIRPKSHIYKEKQESGTFYPLQFLGSITIDLYKTTWVTFISFISPNVALD